MRHIDQVNELLKEKLATLIAREIPLDNGLITVVYVKTTPDLQWAKIGVSVLPENNFGTALEKLRKHNSMFAKEIKKETRLRQIPKFHWVADITEVEAAEIERAIEEAMKSD